MGIFIGYVSLPEGYFKEKISPLRTMATPPMASRSDCGPLGVPGQQAEKKAAQRPGSKTTGKPHTTVDGSLKSGVHSPVEVGS